MLTFPNLLQSIHHDLLQRQLEILQRQEPELFSGHFERMATYTENGLARLQTLLIEANVASEHLDACLALMQSNDRYRFLAAIPKSASFGNVLGESLATGIFESDSKTAGEIAMLLNVFITLLDGILDEVPEIFESDERANFYQILTQRCWQDMNAWQALLTPSTHPVLGLLYRIAQAWTSRLSAPVSENKNDFSKALIPAIKNAMDAEYETASLLDFSESGIPALQKINGKSQNAVWVQALAVASLSTTAADIEYEHYRELIFHIGELAGWVDDLQDLVSDHDSNRWSAAWLMIYQESKPHIVASSPTQLKHLLAMSLGYAKIHTALIANGRRLYRNSQEAIRRVAIQPEPLFALMADTVQSWLQISNYPEADSEQQNLYPEAIAV